METKEWTNRNRTGWGPGPWDGEPDKMQFADEKTGLPCLIVRGPVGALCGYVGVGPTHPWYKVGYSDCTATPKCEDSYCEHGPDSLVHVHGGLTYSDLCDTPTPERFQEMLARREPDTLEALKFPLGDAAERLRDRADIETFEDYETFLEGRSICHIAGPGDPEPAWWFGFDCAHAGDSYPSRNPFIFRGGPGEEYRTVAYVKEQLAKLAEQIAAAAK